MYKIAIVDRGRNGKDLSRIKSRRSEKIVGQKSSGFTYNQELASKNEYGVDMIPVVIIFERVVWAEWDVDGA